ncbi:MAG: hypothetical protein GVY19_06915 [Bacteroidetes bacterium]|jgi:chemotaxis protein methyltransferase CheR|nr:hypothetical protein [Bacteroidota bacterium]
MIELSVVDTRTICRIVQEKHQFDLSGFAHTSLKYRLAKLMAQYKIQELDILLAKIGQDDGFFDSFLHDLLVPSTEMFRDPSLWRWLKEGYFPSIKDKMTGNYKIWLPLCVDGYELHTLTIVLKELELLDKVKIIAGVLTNKSKEVIEEGILPLKKYEISAENYKRYQGQANFDDYVAKHDYYVVRDRSLIKNVQFIKQNNLFDHAPGNVKLILFRNHCIYFNPSMQERVLVELHHNLSATGLFIIGAKEKIKNIESSDTYDLIDEGESVYKKKFVSKS